MLRREQLAQAITRLDVRERELLWLSFRRRVPDDSLAQLYSCSTQEVARRRAAAVDELAIALGVQRGEDFGAILTGLLEPATWDSVTPEISEPVAASPPAEEAPPEPVPAAAALDRPGPRRRALPWALGLALIAAGGAAAVIAIADDGRDGPTPSGEAFVPRQEGDQPAEADTPAAPCYFTARVRAKSTIYTRPGGRRRARVAARTRWGSPRVMSVVIRRAAWLGVVGPELRNNEVGWMPASAARVGCVRWTIRIDLSDRRLQAQLGEHLVRSFQVSVGSRRHPTPTGRFAVTDRLEVSARRSAYGCCVLALSARQPRLRHSRRAGDRIAIHGSKRSSVVGRALGLGSLRARDADARWLIENIPLGAPVFVQR